MAPETTMERHEKREGSAVQPERTRGGRVYSPNVDIIEMNDELLVLADVPGAKPEDLEISYEQGQLTLHACVRARQAEDKTQFVWREYGVGDYYRSFQIGEGIDPQRIEAELKDGVLTLHLPKAEAAKPRKIQVKA